MSQGKKTFGVWRFPPKFTDALSYSNMMAKHHMGAEGRKFSFSSFLERQTDHFGHFTARGLLHECVLRCPLSFASH
jgi:hypothetical protein